MASLKVISFLSVIALISAAAVPTADKTYDLPDQVDVKIKDLVINSDSATLALHSYSISLDSSDPGHATGTFKDVDLEIGHYTLGGAFGPVTLKGEGIISLKMHPTIKVAYTPESDSSLCAVANSTVFDFKIESLEASITNLYADNLKIDGIADKFLSSNPAQIATALQKLFNGQFHSYVDPSVVELINAEC